MRLLLNFKLQNNVVPLDIRRNILSFFKCVLNSNNNKFLDEIYGIPCKKDFSFYVNCSINVIDQKNKVMNLKDSNISIIWSTGDLNLGLIFLNSFIKAKNKTFKMKDNEMKLMTISVINESEIKVNQVLVKTLSPICICDTVDDNDMKKHIFYTYQDDSFQQLVKKKSNLKITPIDCKKRVIYHYDIYIQTSYGVFMLEGSISDLNKALKRGMGDRRSQGFGLLKLL